ncbi:myopalladin-like isoform X2, partial [Lates japonicus]
MEAMEDDSLDIKDDHNHNYCASSSGSKVRTYLSSRLSDVTTVPQPVCPPVPGGEPGARRGKRRTGGGGSSTGGSKFVDSDSGSESSEVSEADCTAPPATAAAAAEGKFTLDSTSKFLLNAMAVEDYRKNHWPNLEMAIDRLLIQNPTDHISVSYAQIYSYVYKCVCQQHSELLYNDLTSKITSHLQHVSTHLQASPPENFIENFNVALTQYTASLQCIVPVFMYLNKFYIESKLNRDLREDLMKLFADHVAEKHVNTLMPLLIEAHSMPFQVQPSTMASVVKGLYSLRPEWAQLAPALFSGFIPQINPPAVESLLSDYAAHDQKLQMELSMNGFPRALGATRYEPLGGAAPRLQIYGWLKGKAGDSVGLKPSVPRPPQPSWVWEELDRREPGLSQAIETTRASTGEGRGQGLCLAVNPSTSPQCGFSSSLRLFSSLTPLLLVAALLAPSPSQLLNSKEATYDVHVGQKECKASCGRTTCSKRIRPRTCSSQEQGQNKKSQSETVYPLGSENRASAVLPKKWRRRPSHCQPPTRGGGAGGGWKPCPDEAPYPAGPCEPPRFIQKLLKSREVQRKQGPVRLRRKRTPCARVRWFCEGKELENSPDIQIITNGELHSLIIAEAFEEDTGRYSCFASNFYGTDSTSAEIYVEGASSSDSEGEQRFEHVAQLQRKTQKSAPTSLPSSGQTVPAEEEEFLSPQPAATTKEPVEELSLPPTNQPLLLGQTTTTVLSVPEISKVSSAQTAQEESTALPVQAFPTSQGNTELSEAQEVLALVQVTSTPLVLQTATAIAPTQTPQPESQTSNHSYLQGLNGQPIMAAPVFTKSLQDLFVSEGQLVVLECRVKGTPSPRVDWYREGKTIEDSPDFRILQKKPRTPAESEEICTLVIAEVFPEDSGVFTCTASNKYGTVSSTAALRVRGHGRITNHVRPVNSLTTELSRIQEPSPSVPTVNPQPEVTVTNSIKPHSSTIRLDPLVSSTLRLDPLNTSTLRLDPHSSSMLRTSLPSLEPSSLSSSSTSSSLNSRSTSTPNLEPLHLRHDPSGSSGAQSSGQVLSYPKPFTSPSVVETSAEQEVSRPTMTSPDTSPKAKGTLNHQNGSPIVVLLPDPPPNSCLKSGTLTNHKDSRSGRVGLRVHFKLPEDEEDEQSDASSRCEDEDAALALANKEPPPVLAKPKLDPAQLQLLHNQVLLEQQQETEPPTQTHTTQPQSHTPIQIQIQPEVRSSHEGLLWSPRMHREPHPPLFQPYLSTTTPPQLAPHSVSPLTTTIAQPAPALNTTFSPPFNTAPAPSFSSLPSIPQLKTSSLVTSPPPASQLSTTTVTQMNTIHASHLNLSPAALARSAPTLQFSSPPAPKLSTVPTDSTPALQQITSPAPLLRSTHASLMNLTATSYTFNYTRPKEFIAAQTFSPVRSPSPTESPVPLLQELAAEINSSAASSPTLPPFSPPPRIFPTRVLKSPTSPPSLVSSPTPGTVQFLNNTFAIRAQSPPQASSPTSSSSTPSPIQNPVAFLSSVLPSLTPSQPTNSMGLPRGAPLGLQKKVPKVRLPSTEEIRESKETLLQDIEKKLRFKDDTLQFAHQQEYKVSILSRGVGEIEVPFGADAIGESDDGAATASSGNTLTPIFDKKLKNFRAHGGCPSPSHVYWFKDGKQILRKNIHYKKIREGDGTCALHRITTGDDDNYTIMAANPQHSGI